MFKAYDISVDDEGKRYIDLYWVKTVRENNRSCYRFDPIDTIYPENIINEVARLKGENYYNANDYFVCREKVSMTNPVAIITFALRPNKLKILEKVYVPIILDDFCYLMGYVVYVNTDTGEEYIIKTKNFGLAHDITEETLIEQGYVHICNSKLINSGKLTNRSRALKLEDI